ncbi:MAG: GNAT family N-acetyltransferase [Actinobacteria bacterium]|uniref:Unannotated protein n=1 Tax=freshwater metagenome TaxID=449393 RepID=A0A6J7R8W4_9ZZZZ|nr:GNAT family N-acetyltransferase [Actinomycetota bacterium]MSX38978.1 GNAT family N-acetyltransferase [Actinomycetota bacterium]
MLRSPVVVRAATEQDVESLTPLWDEFCEQIGSSLVPSGFIDVPERVRERIRISNATAEAGARPTYRLAIALSDGQPIAFASMTVVDRGLMSASSAVLIDVVHVKQGERKRGAGTALLRHAVAFADEVGASDVAVSVAPQVRDANRFYARHGFTQMVTRRSSPVSQLRRKLGVDVRLDQIDTTIELTPVERSLRRRALLSPRRSARSARG